MTPGKKIFRSPKEFIQRGAYVHMCTRCHDSPSNSYFTISLKQCHNWMFAQVLLRSKNICLDLQNPFCSNTVIHFITLDFLPQKARLLFLLKVNSGCIPVPQPCLMVRPNHTTWRHDFSFRFGWFYPEPPIVQSKHLHESKNTNQINRFMVLVFTVLWLLISNQYCFYSVFLFSLVLFWYLNLKELGVGLPAEEKWTLKLSDVSRSIFLPEASSQVHWVN